MNNPICTGWYLALFLCSHLHAVISLPSSPSSNDITQVKERNNDSNKHYDTLLADKDFEKRGWKDNTMQVWGKRGDGLNEPSSATSDSKIDHHNDLVNTEQIKRKWGQNNMPVWGKRNTADAMKSSGSEVLDNNNELNLDKRKWGSNSMTVWGKRSHAHDESLSDYNKRKWGENSMTVWGKRSVNPLQYSSPAIFESKRKWGDNSMSVWGKRSLSESDLISLEPKSRPSQDLLDSDVEAPVKRKWSDNTMQVCGKRKRAEPSEKQNHHSVSKRSLRRLDDETVDLLWRSLGVDSDPSDNALVLPKRNWETNTMRVWGKRSQPRPSALELDDDLQRGIGYVPAWYPVRLSGVQGPQKRVWSSDNELRVWG